MSLLTKLKKTESAQLCGGVNSSPPQSPDDIDERLGGGNVAADVAKRLAQGPAHDVDLVLDAVALANAGPLVPVQPDGVHLVDKGQGPVGRGGRKKEVVKKSKKVILKTCS